MSSIYPNAEDIYHGPVRPIESPTCNCYECVGSDIEFREDGSSYVANNFKFHTLGEPCDNCGRPKGKYRDLGRKGYYVCYVCDAP